jgi:hypothetical protein
MKLDIIISDLNGGDYAVHFVEPSLFDEILWKEGESAEEHNNRVSLVMGRAIDEDPRVCKSVYCQSFVVENLELGIDCEINRIVFHQAC